MSIDLLFPLLFVLLFSFAIASIVLILLLWGEGKEISELNKKDDLPIYSQVDNVEFDITEYNDDE